MKNIILIFILSIFFFPANTQDIILKSNGEEILTNVLEITPELVKFKKAGWSGSPLYSLYIKDINKITFSDGNVEIFNSINIEENNKKENIINKIIDSRDSKEYKIVKIGNQDWFAENLSFKTNNSLVYNNNDDYSEIFGRLYIFEDALNACPDGWHLPSDEEWKQLEVELGMINNIDKKGWRGTHPGQGRLLKKGGGSYFDAVFAGFFYEKYNSYEEQTHLNNFYWKEKKAFFWTSSENIENKNKAWARQLENRASIKRFDYHKKVYGFSVRCIKNN